MNPAPTQQADLKQAGQDAFAGMNVDEAKTGELTQKALTFVYGDATVFGNLINLLKASKGTNGIKEATISVMDRLVSEGIDATQEELMTVGVVVMMHIFDLATKIGVIKEMNEQVFMQTAQEAVQTWIQRNGMPGQQTQQTQQPPAPQEGGLIDTGAMQ